MSQADVKLAIEARSDTEGAPLGAVHAQLWDVLRSYVSRFAGSGDGERILALLDGEAPGWTEADALVYELPPEEPLAAHWIRLALAGELDLVDRMLEEAGYALISPRDGIQEALSTASDGCPMCAMLRPEPPFEQAMIQHLGNGNPDVVTSAAWYLKQTGSPSPEAVAAVIEAGGKADPETLGVLVRAIEVLATRCAADLIDPLRSQAASGRSGARAVALAGACALARTRPDGAAKLADTVLAALNEDNPVAEVAAEQAGYLLREAHRDRAIAALVALLDRKVGETARHNAVLSLVNLHLPPRPLSPDVRKRLEREVAHGSAGANLAEWALRSLG